jgi:ABC-type dipeptide/oligopeptide/nickel transport system permease subunit
MAALLNWGNLMVSVLGSLYVGYSATVVGSLIGTVWAFFDGLIGGAVFAYLYNYLGQLVK